MQRPLDIAASAGADAGLSALSFASSVEQSTSKKRARPGGEGGASELPPGLSPDAASASRANAQPVADASTAALLIENSAVSTATMAAPPPVKKPRRRTPLMIAPAVVAPKAPSPSLASSELPRADEILDALERQAALLERQVRVQEQQNHVMQQLLAFLERSRCCGRDDRSHL